MIKSEEQFKSKVRLVYEYDKKSPVFSRIANWEIENNNTDSAIEILEEGLREYPDYPTPYFILGKAYILKGDYSKALKCYKKGGLLIHSDETYEYYLKVVENIKRQKVPFELKGMGLPDDFMSDKPESDSEKEADINKQSSFDDNLDELAEIISRAKIHVLNEETDNKDYEISNMPDDSLIVSETLAKIYLTQGELQEAISVYEKLKKKNPQKEDYYSNIISGLKEKLDNAS